MENKYFKTKKMDEVWKERLIGLNSDYFKKDPFLKLLHEKLLSIGGEEVAIKFESDLDKIMLFGEVFDGKNSHKVKGIKSSCHLNSALIWMNNKDATVICIGWALSKDGVWRQHTWIFDKEFNAIVETTEKRIAYFGFRLNLEESEEFSKANLK